MTSNNRFSSPGAFRQHAFTPSFGQKTLLKHAGMFQQAFTLLELILGLAILMAGIIGVYALVGKSRSGASLALEQQNAGALIDGVLNEYMSAKDYSGVSAQVVAASQTLGINRTSEGGLRSSFNTPILVRSAKTFEDNDSFDLVYRDLNDNQCFTLIKTLYARSNRILVNEISDPLTGDINKPGLDVQITNGPNDGRLVDDSILVDSEPSLKNKPEHCRHDNFVKSAKGVVVFRFYSPKSGNGPGPQCGGACTPKTSVQTVACPVGQEGQILQQRKDTCTGGSDPTCPLLVLGAWTTLNDTCKACTASSEQQWISDSAPCASGTGTNTWEREQQHSKLCGSDPWGPWADTGAIRNVVNTCKTTDCVVSAGDAFVWTVGTATCNSLAATAAVVTNGNSVSQQDTNAPTTGQAQFICSNGIVSAIPNVGATCDDSTARKPGCWGGGYYSAGVEYSCSGATRYREYWGWNWNTASGEQGGSLTCAYKAGAPNNVQCTQDGGPAGGNNGNPEGYPAGVDCWQGESYSYDLCDGGPSGAAISMQQGATCGACP